MKRDRKIVILHAHVNSQLDRLLSSQQYFGHLQIVLPPKHACHLWELCLKKNIIMIIKYYHCTLQINGMIE